MLSGSRLIRSLFCVTALFIIAYYSCGYKDDVKYPPSPRVIQSNLVKAISNRADHNNTIFLAMLDMGFLDMAINFYETSLKKYDIENYLFVGASREACVELNHLSIACFTYVEDVAGNLSSIYLSPDFIRKMNIRTDMILEALGAAYTVIHVDVDVIFLQNPITELHGITDDISALWDNCAYNAGFLIVRPSDAGKWIYTRLKEISVTSATTDDQTALNQAMDECTKQQKCPSCQQTPTFVAWTTLRPQRECLSARTLVVIVKWSTITGLYPNKQRSTGSKKLVCGIMIKINITAQRIHF